MKKQLLVNVGKYGLGLSLLGYVVWRNWRPANGDVGIADTLNRPIHFLPLILAVSICLVSVLLTFVRWYVLVRAQELPFTLSNATRLGMMGYFLNNFLPTGVGGDVFKAAFLARDQSRRTVAVATVLLDRVIGLWGLFGLVALLGSIFWFLGDPALFEQRSLQVVLLGAICVVAGSIVFWILLGVLPNVQADRFAGNLGRIPKVGHAAAEFWRAVWMYRCKGRSVALALLLSMVGHMGFVLTFYFCARTFFEPTQIPSLSEHFLLAPVGMTIQALGPAPGGVGFGELGFGKLYALVGKPEANGVVSTLVRRSIDWCLGLIGYLVCLRMRPTMPASDKKSPSDGFISLKRGCEVSRAVA